jgi:hypothetical protein
MKAKFIILMTAMLMVLSPLAFSQSKSTGAITGTVYDDTGEALPGVSVTLTSPSMLGERTTVTDVEGAYRFPAIPPGVYAVRAELQGFGTVIQENIRVTTTLRLTVDLTLAPSTIAEEVTVLAESPTVDVKSTETASVTMSKDIISNVPFSNFTSDIVNLAPGVSGDVAFGSSASTGVSYQMDGVDVSDPEAGSAWVFSDPNIIEEAKIMGIGLPAEYGNFTGVIFNVITKSGGNEFSGMLQGIFQGKKDDSPEGFWQADNNEEYIEDYPDMTSPLEAISDFAVNLGGPIVRDKVWFFLGAQYYRSKNYPAGFPEAVDYKQPRAFFKLTAQATPATNLNAFLEYDAYNGVNRASGSWVSPEACVDQESPDIVGNFAMTQIINERTFFDIKGSFFHGYYYLDPEAGPDIPGRYDLNDRMRYDSAGWFFYADRDRLQANTSLTHYAEDFIQGDHDFKFGAEFEYGKVRNRFGYTGPNSRYYVDYTGYGPYGYYYTGNYLAYQYEGYDSNTKYTRLEEFAQDSWKVSDRININAGLRFTHVWGSVKGVDGFVYTNFRVAPRLGITFDLLGDSTTIMKAHYGQFTEAMLASYHDRLNPADAYSDYIGEYWDVPNQEWVPYFQISHENLYSLDPDLKHPFMNQFVVGIERELFKDASLSATFIYRDFKNIVGRISDNAQFEPIDVYVDELGESFTVYNHLNPDDTTYILTNLTSEHAYFDLEPYRNYTGLELMFNKRFSNNWQLIASYIFSQTKGTIDTGFGDDIGWGGATESPNYWINADGNSTNDPTHMLKIQGSVILPLSIQLNAHFRAITGNAWTTRYRTPWFFPGGRVTFFAEQRGSNHYPMAKLLDIRIEKFFTLAQKYRLGLMFDVFNVFNSNTVTSWGTRIGYDWIPGEFPSTDGHELYNFVDARQARIGIRLTF